MPLTPLRLIGPTAPCIIAPTASNLWPTCKRLLRCDVHALPADDCRELMTPFAWTDFAGRDVTFWPNDVWTAHVMTLIVVALTQPEPPNGPMAIIRWAWGSPAAEELGEPAAIIETLWKRHTERESKAA
jgi:hypothetical protein